MQRFDEREIEAVTSVIKSGKLSRFFKSFYGGEQVQSFEVEFADYLGVKHAVSVCNGTVSLEIALQALGIGKGDQVILPPLTFIATATAILRVGATPKFVDIEPETLNIDPYLIEDAINKKTKAIMAVSLNGFSALMPDIMNIAEKHSLFVIEDAAQSLGASINDKKLGTWGTGSFSFQETKTITTGEGGMITTNDDELAEKCRYIRNHGSAYRPELNYGLVSTNARLTEVAAAMGRVQLTKLDAFNEIQTENAEYFLSHLPASLRRIYPEDNWFLNDKLEPVYSLIPVNSEGIDRDKLIKFLTEAGVSQGLPGQNVGYYKSLIYDTPLFRRFRRRCPNAEWARDNVMIFDIHRWHHTIDDAKQVLPLIDEALKS